MLDVESWPLDFDFRSMSVELLFVDPSPVPQTLTAVFFVWKNLAKQRVSSDGAEGSACRRDF